MGRSVLFSLRDASGAAAFARDLVEEFGFRVFADEEMASKLRTAGIAADVFEGSAASFLMDPRNEVRILAANFLQVEQAARGFDSWKSALQALDRDRVEALRTAALLPDRMAALDGPEEFALATGELRANGGTLPRSFCLERATRALRATSDFDFAVAQYLEVQGAEAPDMAALGGYPKALRLVWSRAVSLKSGDNDHQQAALYGSFFEHFEQVAGGELDFEAILTVSRAAYFIGEFERPVAALWRKGKLVAARFGDDARSAAGKLLAATTGERLWLVVNGSLGVECLRAGLKARLGGILAPDFSDGERAVLHDQSETAALVSLAGMGYEALQEVRSVVGGALAQDRDRAAINPMEWTVLSLAQPLVDDWEGLMLGAKTVRHLDSSACVAVRDGEIVGLEYGRVSTSEAWKSLMSGGLELSGASLVFDEALENVDSLRQVKSRGARLVVCPFGGPVEDLRAEANQLGLTLMTMPKGLRRL